MDLIPFRGDAGCFTAGVMGDEEGRFGQPCADGAAFIVLIFVSIKSLLKLKELC